MEEKKKIIKCSVNGQRAEIISGSEVLENLREWSDGYVFIEAAFSPEWEDMAITASFEREKKGARYVARLAEDGFFAVPREVIKEPGFRFAFLGVKEGASLTTNPLRISIAPSFFDENRCDIQDRCLFEQMLSAFEREKTAAEGAVARAEEAAENASKSAALSNASEGNACESALSAGQSAKEAAEYALSAGRSAKAVAEAVDKAEGFSSSAEKSAAEAAASEASAAASADAAKESAREAALSADTAKESEASAAESAKTSAEGAESSEASARSAAASAKEVLRSAHADYIWCVHKLNPTIDVVIVCEDGEWKPTNKMLKEFEKDEYIGVWFQIEDGSGSTGITTYSTSTYDIAGADGCLKCLDYLVWMNRWVRISIYDATASTEKTDEGLYSGKSGTSGLIDPADAAYLADLKKRYISSCDTEESHNSGWGCDETGFYSHVTLGRPAGVTSGDVMNLISIRDRQNAKTSQLMMSQNLNDETKENLWFRGSVENPWVRVLNQNDLITTFGVEEDSAAWANWLRDPGIYKVTIQDSDSACPPTTNGRDFLFIVMSGAPSATSQSAVTQIAVNRRTKDIHIRYASSYSGTGSLGATASEWIEVMRGETDDVAALKQEIEELKSLISQGSE